LTRRELRKHHRAVGRGKVAPKKRPIVTQNLTDIALGFLDRRKGAITVDDVLSRVVGGQSKRKVAAKSVQEEPKIFRAPSDVVFGVVEILHVQTNGGLRHELHEPDRSRAGYRPRVKIRFGLDDGPNERGRELVLA